ncbi:MAG: amino acid ABC transporter permease [Clostridium sp.]
MIELLPLLLKGLKITIWVSSIAFILSVFLGAILAIVQFFKVKVLSILVKIYISYFRGTPLLIQLFIFYYGFPMIFDFMKTFPKTEALILCLALNSSAYIAEIIRGSIESVDKGQYEACLAFGMSKTKMMTRIILPQAAVSSIPPIVNSALDIIKMSSLGMTIGIQDIMGEAQLAAAVSYKMLETYIVAAAFYWIISVILSKVQKMFEIKVGLAYRR